MKNAILTGGLVLGAALFTGCASMGMSRAPKCYDYPKQNFRICEANPAYVNEVCDKGELSDGGDMIANPKRFYGCADHMNHVAWIAWDAPQPETTIHEICHMLRNDPSDCEKIQPTPTPALQLAAAR